MCFLWGTCIGWKCKFFEVQLKCPLSGNPSQSQPSKVIFFLCELPQPCGYTSLTPECSVLPIVFLCACPPTTWEQIEADSHQILKPNADAGSASEDVPSNVSWLNEWNYWPGINGHFCALRNLSPFFSSYLFSPWCFLSPCVCILECKRCQQLSCFSWGGGGRQENYYSLQTYCIHPSIFFFFFQGHTRGIWKFPG